MWTNFSHELFIFIYVWKFNFYFFFGCSFEGEISFTSNKKNYLWGKWNLGRFNKIRKCEKWKLFLFAWLLHLSLLRVWYHSLVMEQFKHLRARNIKLLLTKLNSQRMNELSYGWVLNFFSVCHYVRLICSEWHKLLSYFTKIILPFN